MIPGLPWQCAVGQPGDLHDGSQLGRRELLVDRVVDLGEHAARGAHLDHLGVLPQLLAGDPGALVGSVGQPHEVALPAPVLHPVQGEGVQVRVPAGGGQDRACGVDGRAVQDALGDGAGQVQAETADLAHRGDARVQRGPQISRRAGPAQGQREERELLQVKTPGAEEVPVAVPHPRHDRRRARDRDAGRRRGRPGRTCVADPGSVEHDHPAPDGLAVSRNE
jgi:hypothetical protein